MGEHGETAAGQRQEDAPAVIAQAGLAAASAAASSGPEADGG